jgi:hypothetical protein
MKDSKNPEMEEAAEKLMTMRSIEAAAREQRVKAEEALADMIGVEREGSTTYKSGHWTVKTTGNLYRKLDAKAYASFKDDLPPEALSAIRSKLEINLPYFRELQYTNRDAFGMLAQCITTTPGKASVSVTFDLED